jgi:acyl CoA:acetate/3-ketoacid CoA transferase beta subunit
VRLIIAGLPTLAPSYLDPETKVWIQSENGLLGMVSLDEPPLVFHTDML